MIIAFFNNKNIERNILFTKLISMFVCLTEQRLEKLEFNGLFFVFFRLFNKIGTNRTEVSIKLEISQKNILHYIVDAKYRFQLVERRFSAGQYFFKLSLKQICDPHFLLSLNYISVFEEF